MVASKRRGEDTPSTRKLKKAKLSEEKGKRGDALALAQSNPDEVDFPRGGGTTLSALEVKAIQREGVKEADQELFKENQAQSKKLKMRKRNETVVIDASDGGANKSRVEHLNYKRLVIGMGILGQIVSVQPLALIISLPNQLFGHVPITQISTQLTSLLEAMEGSSEKSASEDVEEDEEEEPKSAVPDLADLFHVGQYVRAIVSAVHESGTTDMTGIGKTRDGVARASRRVELCLIPGKVNAGVQKADLRPGLPLTAAVKSLEDHGYLLDLGIPDVPGFLKAATKGSSEAERFKVGQLMDIVVNKVSANGRTCNVTVDAKKFANSVVSEVSSVTSAVPGMLVQSIITAVNPTGLNLQVLGFFEGTIDPYHLSGSPETYKVGRKVKARILYTIPSTPLRFALSLVDHVVGLVARKVEPESESSSLQEAYPIGTVLNAVKVLRVEPERGLVVDVQSHVQGHIHISHVSDEHTPSLSPSTGPWKVGTSHSARVIGYYAFDGLLQLSLRPSILAQKFLQVADLQVGEIVKGTIKRLGDTGLVVTISGNLTGIVWPNHYADITLKHPEKRFKVGGKIKCRVLTADPERNHIALTAKKSLVDSDLPIISCLSDASIGLVTRAVIMKVTEKRLIVEFYNRIKATVFAKEASDTNVPDLSEIFSAGKVVKVRIISVNPEDSLIQASIRQAAPDFKSPVTDITGIEIGNVLSGTVTEIHKDNAVLTLRPKEARALISLKNLANHRRCPVVQLRGSLKQGDGLDDLVVVARNPEKGLVIVATKPQTKEALPSKGGLLIETVAVGQIVFGRVIRHTRQGALMKLSSRLNGTLHPTDVSDDYDTGTPFPVVDTVMKAMVVNVDKDKKIVALSTRQSRMHPNPESSAKDRELKGLDDLKKGDTVRGFIKSVAEHGLFVTLGRDVDARVQIRELFDDYIKDWKSGFAANQLVKGRILSVDAEKKQVEMTLRSGDLKRDSASLSLSDFQQGQIVDAKVKRVEDYGLFLQIEGAKISGLCHKSELSDNPQADVSIALRSFHEGDQVKAKILSIDAPKRRVSFGLKPSYLSDQAAKPAEADEAEDDQTSGVVKNYEDPSADEAAGGDDDSEDSKGLSEDDGDSDNDADETIHIDLGPETGSHVPAPMQKTAAKAAVQPLKIGGFQWTLDKGPTESSHLEPASSSEEDVEQGTNTNSKKRRRKEIEQDLTADMHSKPPESNADFERMLLGSPNSSYLWVQYMSFQMQLSEVEKAREIGRRALETISFREEQEKLNVWIALLNLENIYGTPESLQTLFKEAARRNDSKTIHLRLASIFEQSGKYQEAEDQYKQTCKKFGQSSKAWTLFAEYYLHRGDPESASKLLPRSLQSLEKRKHLKTISKFAQLEYKLGDPERGKTIFEGMVDSHPKRWDLWSIYIDMEASKQEIQSIRNIFDCVLAIKMTSYKAKAFFKKWLELERRIGDEDGATVVKQKAVAWTQNAANSS